MLAEKAERGLKRARPAGAVIVPAPAGPLLLAALLETRPYREEGQRARQDYVLTRKDWGVQPVLVALMEWGDAYLAGPEGPPIRILHRDCGKAVSVTLQCSCGAQHLDPRDLYVQPWPGALAARELTPAVLNARMDGSGDPQQVQLLAAVLGA